jgi:hypothetical protein
LWFDNKKQQVTSIHMLSLELLEDEELLLLLLVLQLLEQHAEEIVEKLERLAMEQEREEQRLLCKLPRVRSRVSWKAFTEMISPRHFQRMFRMTLPVFSLLCKRIEESVGEDQFRSKEYLANKLAKRKRKRRSKKTLPPIAGEVKLGICIRMLAGGSYLDLVPLFDLSSSHLYNVFTIFLDWITATFELPLARWLRERNWEQLQARANDFAERSDGIFYGPFAANDGLAVQSALKCQLKRMYQTQVTTIVERDFMH